MTALAMLSNALEPPPDEGIRKCAQELAAALRHRGVSIYAVGTDSSFGTRKLLLSRPLIRRMRREGVRVVIYVPTQSATLGSLVRSALVRSLTGARVVLLSFQPRALSSLSRPGMRWLGPDRLLTPDPSMVREAERHGVRAGFLPIGADTGRFHPVDGQRKLELRRRYGLPTDRRIVLHVGHARRLRGLAALVGLGSDITSVVVVGTSLGADAGMVRWLRRSGVWVLDRYLPEVQEIYQLADAYVFPVRDAGGASAAPLSVLEAMACNLPVVSTRFGALPALFEEGRGFAFADTPAQMRAEVLSAVRLPPEDVGTRSQVLPLTWPAAADALLTTAKQLCNPT
jgi:glycosyltransferase involved in cell wall biosynthesis